MIEPKERFRRFTVRLKTLFNVPEYYTYKVDGKTKRDKKLSYARIPVNIPNFWYTPFEVYVLAHLQRARFIMTCNEWGYVDSATEFYVKYFALTEKNRQEIVKNKETEREQKTKELIEKLEKISKKLEAKNETKNTQTEPDN